VHIEEENRIAFEKFDDHLRLNKCEYVGDTDFDVREWILSERFAEWNVGYTSESLRKKYGANMPSLFPHARGFDEKGFGVGHHYLAPGTIYQNSAMSHKGGVKLLQPLQDGDRLVFFEQGFLATSHSWSESFKSNSNQLACLGYVYDDISHYFMADYPNRLIHRLNSSHLASTDELARARAAMQRIVEQKISKYNSQPIHSPTMSEGYAHRVMVCDQAFADASTYYGKLTEDDFEQMLLAAIRENPEAQILIKTHPDTHWEKGKRVGYYNHLEDVGRIRILREPINPYCLFECVDKVYVGTSQMGFEALLAGKQVVCFGAPFYAGWGLTDDRQPIPHRHRKRSLDEVFYYFYIWYTIYHCPGCATPSQIEEVLDFIVQNRPASFSGNSQKNSEAPKISVILPVYGVEKYIDECLHSIRRQTLQDIEIITVNDCSPDGSQAIIDRHAAEDKRIRPILLKQNIGQGLARNVGIESAKGDYIQFIDSDDFFATNDYLESVYTTAIQDDAQMVRGRKIYEQLEDARGRQIGLRRDWCESYFEKSFRQKTLVEKKEIIQGRHFWNWLYKKDFLLHNDIRFLTPQWEEKPFVLKALLRATCISTVNCEGFIYRVRIDSTARRKKELKDAECQLSNFESLVDLLFKAGAFERESDLFEISRFIMTQYLSIILTGFVHETILRDSGITGELALFDRLNCLVKKSGMRASDVSHAPENLRKDLKTNHAYSLIFAGLLSEKYEYVRTAISLKPIQQEEYITEMLRVPESEADRQLQEALSLFARNGLVIHHKSAAVEAARKQKKPRLVIHVGSTKTGSTFIQHFLEQNRAALMRAGVYVPEVGLFWQPDRPHKQAGHAHFAPAAVKGDDALKAHIDAAVTLCSGRIHTVILSSEAYFLNPRSVEIARQFADYSVEMLVYFRRQDEWANSQYAEFVAGGAMGRVDCAIEKWLGDEKTQNRMNYLSTIKLWESVVGRENIRIGIYDRARLERSDIVSDFLTRLGLEEVADLPRPAAQSQNAFPFASGHVNLIRHLNQQNWPSHEQYLQFIEDAGREVVKLRLAADMPKPQVDLLSIEIRNKIMSDFAESNSILAKEYLGCDSDALFPPLNGFSNNEAGYISGKEIDAIMESFRRHISGTDALVASAKTKKVRVKHSSLRDYPWHKATGKFCYRLLSGSYYKLYQSRRAEMLPKLSPLGQYPLRVAIGKFFYRLYHGDYKLFLRD